MVAPDSGFQEEQQAGLRAFAGRLAAGVVVANALVLVLVVLVLVHLRHEREDRARVAAQNLSRLLERDLGSLIDKADLTLLAVADEAAREERRGGLDRGAMGAFLASQHARVPEFDNLLVADGAGDILAGADLPPGAAVNVSQREFFGVQRAAQGSRLHISRPFVGRLARRWLVVVTRGLRRPDGSFLGVAWCVLSLEYFSRLFASLDIGPTGGISLRDAEMGIIARHPAPADLGSIIGNKVLSPELRRLFEAGRTEGTFHTPTSWDHTAKVVSFRRIGTYPLFVNVGIATDDYLAGWRTDAARLLSLAALFLLATVLLSWALFARYRREKLAEVRLHALNAELEERVAARTDELHARNAQLEGALTRVKQLEGIIPICMYCKKIRDDHQDWQQLEKYITEHSEALFSHGICPSCSRARGLGPE